jgi:hypothetical protein
MPSAPGRPKTLLKDATARTFETPKITEPTPSDLRSGRADPQRAAAGSVRPNATTVETSVTNSAPLTAEACLSLTARASQKRTRRGAPVFEGHPDGRRHNPGMAPARPAAAFVEWLAGRYPAINDLPRENVADNDELLPHVVFGHVNRCAAELARERNNAAGGA